MKNKKEKGTAPMATRAESCDKSCTSELIYKYKSFSEMVQDREQLFMGLGKFKPPILPSNFTDRQKQDLEDAIEGIFNESDTRPMFDLLISLGKDDQEFLSNGVMNAFAYLSQPHKPVNPVLVARYRNVASQIKGGILKALQKSDKGFSLPDMDYEIEQTVCEIHSEILNGRPIKEENIKTLEMLCTPDEFKLIFDVTIGYFEQFTLYQPAAKQTKAQPIVIDIRDFWKGIKRLKRRPVTNNERNCYFSEVA